MAYFGDTMAHSALLGVALALILDINLMIGVFAVAVAISAILLLLQKGIHCLRIRFWAFFRMQHCLWDWLSSPS